MPKPAKNQTITTTVWPAATITLDVADQNGNRIPITTTITATIICSPLTRESTHEVEMDIAHQLAVLFNEHGGDAP